MDKYLDSAYWQETGTTVLKHLTTLLTSPQFYVQIVAILVSLLLAFFIAKILRTRIPLFQTEPLAGRFFKLRQWIYICRDLIFAALIYIFLGLAAAIVKMADYPDWLVLIARGFAIIYLLIAATNRLISHPLARTAILWIGIPLATLQVFGHYGTAVNWLDQAAIQFGNIRISLLFIIKAAIASALFFWLGRVSNNTGQAVIRNQEALATPTKELFAKLFQIALFAILFILLMQVLGINLTALTVFGGALGVGLGFGLQQIASNFISGIILLLERSLGVGDYIELENGQKGILKELNMRSTTLETFDGKEIMVPNEKFITSTFLNWTRDDPRQRYEVEFRVAYDTDLRRVPPLISAAVSKHPRVLMKPEKPDCELRGFTDYGVKFAVEFWVDGIDDGPNKFSSDVLFLVWETLRDNNIEIPVPQRDIRILPEGKLVNIQKGEVRSKHKKD